jgi:hypothetical protein
VAERVIPRIVLGYVLGNEEMARCEAEKLHDVVLRLDGSRGVKGQVRIAS